MTQIGQFLPAEKADDTEATRAEIRMLAQELAALRRFRITSDIQVILHRDVSEANWHMMESAYGMGEYPFFPWHPGIDVWGWKAEAEPLQPAETAA